jgi:muramoyltetrapeptide carboxypeptidase
MKTPPLLRKGDSVGIIVPASPVKEPFRSNGLKELTELGFVPEEVPNLLARNSNDFVARGPEENVSDLQCFFKADEIAAIWAGRGGYGSNHLLPLLQRLDVPAPKMVIGSSDISYLLWYLMDHFHMVVFYGPMTFSSLPAKRYNRENLLAVLSGNCGGLQVKGETLMEGTASGVVTGGCLSNLVSLIGTPYFPEVRQRILLLEDVGERPYRLDRMFWQLEQAGVLAGTRALLLGEFPGCFNNEGEKDNFLQRVRGYVGKYHIPVIYDLPYGHSDNIHTLPLGVEMEINTRRFSGITLPEL